MNSKSIEIIGKKCIQCHICETVCPHKCITFSYNEKGFIVPKINNECIQCGACLSSCPSFEKNVNKHSYEKPIKVFYGFNNNIDERSKSSSGGIFYLLAKKAKEMDFDVISTTYSDNLRKCFYSNSSDSPIEKMRQSKYCESDFSGVIQIIKNNLIKNKKTLVCGTPCHINSIRHLFKNDENLFLVDFVCHGVPSTKLFNDSLNYYEKKMGGTITQIDFRYKSSAYSTSLALMLSTEKKKIVVPWQEDRYYYAFEKLWILRDSCYYCDFKNRHSGDITVGDFWDGKKYNIEVDNKNGCSIIFVNNNKGNEMLKLINSKLTIAELPFYQGYSAPHKQESDYNKQVLFFETLNDEDFISTCDHLFFKKLRIKLRIKRFLKIG